MRRVEPLTNGHREGLFALYGRIFGASKGARFRQRFDWQYGRNPYTRDGQITNWILTSDRAVVGHLGVIPMDLKVGDQRVHGSWICDYMVDPEHRVGSELAALRATASDSADLPIGYGLHDHVVRSYMKLDWKPLAVGSFLIKCLEWRAISSLFAGPRAAGPAGRAGAALRRAADVPRFCRPLLRRRMRPTPAERPMVALPSAFDDALDRLWERVADAYPVGVERTCRYLTWRYRICGPEGARLLVLRGDAVPRGFALIERVRWRGIDVGLISELIWAPERHDDARSLLAAIEDVMRRERVAAIVTEGFPPRIRRTLLANGFLEYPQRKENAVFFDRLRRCPPPLIGEVDNWLLTPGDSDRSLGYPRAPWREL